MRRFLSLVLLAVFSLLAVAPALALVQNGDSHLPACCRRHGAHHCGMNVDSAPSETPLIAARCPSFPQPSVTSPTGTMAALTDFARLTAPHSYITVSAQRAEIQRCIARERSLHKRGPPAELL